MTRTKLRACPNCDRDVTATAGRFGNVQPLIDDSHDATCAELEQVVVHLPEDGFRHAVLEMHAAMRMNKIVFVVVFEERSEADAFDVKVCVAQKAGAACAERGAHAVAAV